MIAITTSKSISRSYFEPVSKQYSMCIDSNQRRIEYFKNLKEVNMFFENTKFYLAVTNF